MQCSAASHVIHTRPVSLNRLREIEMSEFDATLYQKMLAKVQRQIQTLRVMLETLEVCVCGC